jgi:hypothetical protein
MSIAERGISSVKPSFKIAAPSVTVLLTIVSCAVISVYDALYPWRRDGTEETYG